MPKVNETFPKLYDVFEREAYSVQYADCVDEIHWKIDDMLFHIYFVVDGLAPTLRHTIDPIVCQTYLGEVEYV